MEIQQQISSAFAGEGLDSAGIELVAKCPETPVGDVRMGCTGDTFLRMLLAILE